MTNEPKPAPTYASAFKQFMAGDYASLSEDERAILYPKDNGDGFFIPSVDRDQVLNCGTLVIENVDGEVKAHIEGGLAVIIELDQMETLAKAKMIKIHNQDTHIGNLHLYWIGSLNLPDKALVFKAVGDE